MYKQKKIILIAALQSDRGIGFQGDLLYHIKNDMKHFVEMTTGHTVIMGRKNWDSIPEKYRPFKDRENIIVTRQKDFKAEGAIVVHSIEEALEQASSETIYIIGGAEIYALALPYADVLDLTISDAEKEADTFFPAFGEYFEKTSSEKKVNDEVTGLTYQFQIWKRK